MFFLRITHNGECVQFLFVACCADKRLFSVVALFLSLFLDTLWCHALCVCSQRCRFMCDGLHDTSCLAQVNIVIRTVSPTFLRPEVWTAHASISEFASRCSVVLKDLDIMSTSTTKIWFPGSRLHNMLPYPTPCSGRQWIRVNASFLGVFEQKLTFFVKVDSR